MKYLIWTLIFSIAFESCKNSNLKNNTAYGDDSINSLDESTHAQIKQYIKESLDSEFNETKVCDLTEILKEDFNGDGNIDAAEFKSDDDSSGIIITYGGSNNVLKLGFGKRFAHMDNFNWVDMWGIVKDTVTFEILFENNEISGDTLVRLEYPSIVLIKEEGSVGLITYKNGEFVWIHQTD